MTLVNVLSGGTASADSELSGTYSADKACDGNVATFWNSASGAFPHWWQYQFDRPRIISRIRIRPYWDSGGGYVRAFVFSGSNNGVDWVQIMANVVENYDDWQDFAETNLIPFLFYRLTVSSFWRGDTPYCVIKEMEMYEDDRTVLYLAGRPRNRVEFKPVSFRMDRQRTNVVDEPTSNTYTADSEYSTAFSAAKGCDAFFTTYWNSANTAFPHWWQVQLASRRIVDAIDIRPYGDAGGVYIKDFTFSGSQDGANWTDLLTAQVPNSLANTIAWHHEWPVLNTVAYLYYRFTISNGWVVGSNYAVVREFNLVYDTQPRCYLTPMRSRIDLSPISSRAY
jgi:hypothetical protein